MLHSTYAVNGRLSHAGELVLGLALWQVATHRPGRLCQRSGQIKARNPGETVGLQLESKKQISVGKLIKLSAFTLRLKQTAEK